MKEFKTIEELEISIKDARFLALFRSFVKALELKDIKLCIKLTYLRYAIGILEKLHLNVLVKLSYMIVYRVISNIDYLYWESKMLNDNN